MNKYNIRVEFDIVSTDYLDVKVNANSREEAINQVLKLHEDGNLDMSDMYASDHMDSSISENTDDWIVDVEYPLYNVGDMVTFYESFEIAGEYITEETDDEFEKPFRTCAVNKAMLLELDKWQDNEIESIDEDGDIKFVDFGWTWPVEVIKGISND